MLTINIFFTVLILFNITLIISFDFYSKFFKIFDYPNTKRKFHKKKIKVFGGTIILYNLFFFFLFFYFFNKNVLMDVFFNDKDLILFIFTVTIIYFIGLLDDAFNLPALNKLFLTGTIISINLFLSKNLVYNINLSFFDIIYLNKFSFFFTLLSYLIFMNAFNMLDGVNLQIGSYSSFLIIFLMLNGLNLIIGLTILIALLTYLKLNYNNKIFLGDNGTLLLGYVFSFFFIKLYNAGKIKFSDEILLVLLLPGLEIIRLIFFRILANKNILTGDTNHIHHIIDFKKNNFLNIFFIQFMIILPYFLSIFLKNFLIIIVYCLFYFLVIFYFKKK